MSGRVKWWVGCGAALLLAAAGSGLAVGQGVDCDKPIEPCTACHSAESARPYAVCLAQQWVAPESAKELKNPLSDTPKVVAFGKSTYDIYCDGCHGVRGDGKGHVALKFSVPVVNISASTIQAQTDGELFWKISTGRGAMPSWKTLLPEEDRWRLVRYIRTFSDRSAAPGK
jgi:mono/diheme cytochrome c family protein